MIAYYRQELQKFEEDITEQRKKSFQFSVEELYYMYGQYDKANVMEEIILSRYEKRIFRRL